MHHPVTQHQPGHLGSGHVHAHYCSALLLVGHCQHVPCAPQPWLCSALCSTAHLSEALVSAFYHRCRLYRGSDSPLRN